LKRGRIRSALVVLACAALFCAVGLAQGATAAEKADAPADTDAVTATGGAGSIGRTGAEKPDGSWLDTDTPSKRDSALDDAPGLGNVLIRLTVAMLVIIGVLVGGLFVVQKISRRKFNLGFGGKDRSLRVVDRLTLGSKTYVCLMQVCGRYLVVGVTEKEMTVLTEVALPGEPEDGDKEMAFSGVLADAKSGANTERSSEN